MKFEIPASQRDLKITKTALALSGIADAETYEVFTTPNAVVVIDGQMTAKELFSAAASLRMLASDLLMQLAESCDDVCENCDENISFQTFPICSSCGRSSSWERDNV